MKRRLGAICMCLGGMLVLAALSLFAWNCWEDTRAGAASAEILPRLVEQIEAEMSTHSTEVPEAEIDGYTYAGFLSFPTLGLELPVMDQWDYDRLKLAPCQYAGTASTNDLVIAGHNYTRHFGRLDRLSPGDKVYFTGLDGMVITYEVAETELLQPTAVEEMTGSGYALTLFTCDYSGRARITVRCDRVAG